MVATAGIEEYHPLWYTPARFVNRSPLIWLALPLHLESIDIIVLSPLSDLYCSLFYLPNDSPVKTHALRCVARVPLLRDYPYPNHDPREWAQPCGFIYCQTLSLRVLSHVVVGAAMLWTIPRA